MAQTHWFVFSLLQMLLLEREREREREKRKDLLQKRRRSVHNWRGTVWLDFQEKIAKAKLKCHCSTHKSGILALPDVLRVNKFTHENRLENSMILFTDDDYVTGVIADASSNEDPLFSIKGKVWLT